MGRRARGEGGGKTAHIGKRREGRTKSGMSSARDLPQLQIMNTTLLFFSLSNVSPSPRFTSQYPEHGRSVTCFPRAGRGKRKGEKGGPHINAGRRNSDRTDDDDDLNYSEPKRTRIKKYSWTNKFTMLICKVRSEPNQPHRMHIVMNKEETTK